jgi:hypothetical protein
MVDNVLPITQDQPKPQAASEINDYSQYKDILPYASEIFCVYQPLLGWRSRRIQGRVEKGFNNDLSRAFESLYKKFKGRLAFTTRRVSW